MMRGGIVSEHDHAKAFVRVVGLYQQQRPELALLFAVPNGGDRHEIVAWKMKAEGVKAGVPDYIFPVARGGFHGLAIELKSATGKASREQVRWIESLRDQGWRAEVCRGWGEAMRVLADYCGFEFRA